MHDKERVRISKFLSKHLRHEPEALGLELAPGGWVDVTTLLAACARHRFPVTNDQLREVVARCDKQRFAFDETGERVRANQGHSADVDLQLEATAPPAVLFHGTAAANVPLILADGLRRMARHHVHLSADVATALKVGGRHGKPVVFAVDAAAMHAAGHVFYRSANSVWLADAVPPAFLRLLDDPAALPPRTTP